MMDREEFEDLLCAITASTIANIVEETGMSEEEAADGVKDNALAPVRARFFVRAYHRFVGRRRSEGSGVFHQYYITLTQN